MRKSLLIKDNTIEFFEGLKIENLKKSIVQRLFAKRIS